MEFIKHLKAIRRMSPELSNHLLTIIKTRTLKKDEFLLKSADICENVYFIKEGLLRGFYLRKGRKEVTRWFLKENDVILVERFLEQMPNKEAIQALEDCTLQYITYSELQDTFLRFMEFNFHGLVITARNAALSEDRIEMLKNPEPLERYLHLLNKDQAFINRIGDKYIASHLEISVIKLSQLKKMSKKTFIGNIKLS